MNLNHDHVTGSAKSVSTRKHVSRRDLLAKLTQLDCGITPTITMVQVLWHSCVYVQDLMQLQDGS